MDILFHRMRNTAGNHDGIFLINDIIYLQQIPKSGICSFFDLVIRPIIRFYFSSEQIPRLNTFNPFTDQIRAHRAAIYASPGEDMNNSCFQNKK